MRPLKSSALTAAGYDQAEQQLRVQFKGGSACTYYGVPKSVFDGLVGAESAGRYLAKHVKPKFSTKPPRSKRDR